MALDSVKGSAEAFVRARLGTKLGGIIRFYCLGKITEAAQYVYSQTATLSKCL